MQLTHSQQAGRSNQQAGTAKCSWCTINGSTDYLDSAVELLDQVTQQPQCLALVQVKHTHLARLSGPPCQLKASFFTHQLDLVKIQFVCISCLGNGKDSVQRQADHGICIEIHCVAIETINLSAQHIMKARRQRINEKPSLCTSRK